MEGACDPVRKTEKLSGRQWWILIVESLGWSGVMVMGYFFNSYYALIQDVFAYTSLQMTDLMAITAAAGGVSYLLGGVLADVLKPKVSLSVAYLGLTACGAVILSHPSYPVMALVAVLLTVFGLGVFTPSMLRYVATLGSRAQSAKIYGYFYTLASVESLIVAPVSAWIIGRSGSGAGLESVVVFFCAMMLLSLAGHMLWVERNGRHTGGALPSADKQLDDAFRWSTLIGLLKNPNMWFVLLVGYATSLPYDLNTYVQPLLASEFGASQSVIAFIAAYANNGTTILLAPLAGAIALRLGSTYRLMALSLVVAIASLGSLLLIPWAPTYMAWAVVIVFALRSVFSIGKPARNSMIGESRLPRSARGTVIGMMFATNCFMDIVLARMTGALLTRYGAAGYRIIYGAALAVFCAALLGCMVFDRKLKRARARDQVEGAPEDLMI